MSSGHTSLRHLEHQGLLSCLPCLASEHSQLHLFPFFAVWEKFHFPSRLSRSFFFFSPDLLIVYCSLFFYFISLCFFFLFLQSLNQKLSFCSVCSLLYLPGTQESLTLGPLSDYFYTENPRQCWDKCELTLISSPCARWALNSPEGLSLPKPKPGGKAMVVVDSIYLLAC